mgnify:CR=1 FL=1
MLLGRPTKIKFKPNARLEEIRFFEKPHVEDNHKLYYTAMEMQTMIEEYLAEVDPLR